MQAKFDEGYQSAVLAADDAMKGVSSAILTLLPVTFEDGGTTRSLKKG